MPTVCASLPVHAPTTTILRASRALMRCSISSRESLRAHLRDVDDGRVDRVARVPVDDEVRVALRAGFHRGDERLAEAVLLGEALGGLARARRRREREHEAHLDHAVAFAVAVGAEDVSLRRGVHCPGL